MNEELWNVYNCLIRRGCRNLQMGLAGFNKLRAAMGLEPIKPSPGETLEHFRERYYAECEIFLEKHGPLRFEEVKE